jgi:hypothetical protein
MTISNFNMFMYVVYNLVVFCFFPQYQAISSKTVKSWKTGCNLEKSEEHVLRYRL